MKNRIKRRYLSTGILMAIMVLSWAFTPKRDQEPVRVCFAGALKNMMHKGDLSAKISMDTLSGYKNMYALGARENLKGEILVLNSEIWSTSVENHKIKFLKDQNDKAALLVYANVPEWTEQELPDQEMTKEKLEKQVLLLARKNGNDTDQPFPFLIKGKVKSLDWHIIDWKDGDQEHSHEKHVNSGLHDNFKDTAVEILGFYSEKHQTIFTHHTSFMHLHFKTEDNTLAGHADDLITGRGMKIYLPTIKK